MKKKFYFLVCMFIFAVSAIALIFLKLDTNLNNPDKVIENLYKSIEKAEEKGEYRCCIEPPCTMCYLGKWKFEKGTCYCDDAILEGRDEDVCPECKKGLEEGLCKSGKICELNEKIYG